jgi:hypothetical protein
VLFGEVLNRWLNVADVRQNMLAKRTRLSSSPTSTPNACASREAWITVFHGGFR